MALVHDEANPYLKNNPSVAETQRELAPVKRISTNSLTNEKDNLANEKYPANSDPNVTNDEPDKQRLRRHELYLKFRPYVLTGIALVILGWWISATVLKATRHRWYITILVVVL